MKSLLVRCPTRAGASFLQQLNDCGQLILRSRQLLLHRTQRHSGLIQSLVQVFDSRVNAFHFLVHSTERNLWLHSVWDVTRVLEQRRRCAAVR